MLVASRQLSFWRRLHFCDNGTISALMRGVVGDHGALAASHVYIRQQYDLVNMDLSRTQGPDIRNMFCAMLERFVRQRQDAEAENRPLDGR